MLLVVVLFVLQLALFAPDCWRHLVPAQYQYLKKM